MEENFGDGYQEITVLQSIYGDDLIVQRSKNERGTVMTVEMKVQPVQVGNCSPATIRVKFILSSEYPSLPPQVLLLQPRGIDDVNLLTLKRKINEHLESNAGVEILYDLLQLIQTFIENVQSTPSAVCPICLGKFSPIIPSMCTSCEHYVHVSCFAKYVDYSRKEIQRELDEWPDDMKYKVDQTLRCPVCRVELSKGDLVVETSEGSGGENRIDEDAELFFDWDNWRQLQRELEIIYENQRRKGGIIDIEKEKNKNLVTENTVVTITKVHQPSTSAETSGRNDKLSDLPRNKKRGIDNCSNNFRRGGGGRRWRNNNIRNSYNGNHFEQWRRDNGRSRGTFNQGFLSAKQHFHSGARVPDPETITTPSTSALVSSLESHKDEVDSSHS